VIGVERRGSAAWVTIDRPEARNAMTFAMYEALHAAFERLDADPEVRAVVLRGAGHTFAAGTDITEFRAMSTGEDGLAYEARVDRVIARLEAVRVPTVALVEGYAVGGGLALAAGCDLRVCTPEARFGMPIARTLGNCLSMANYARLVALVGESRVRDLVLTTRLVAGEEARAIGLATEVVGPDAIEAHVAALCDRLAGNAPITLRVTKEALLRLRAARLPDGDDLIREAYASQDFHDAVAAFGEKRKPEWRGR